MARPDYQSLMLPLLRFAAQKETETSTSEAVESLAKELGLTENDLEEMLPSGTQANRAWKMARPLGVEYAETVYHITSPGECL